MNLRKKGVMNKKVRVLIIDSGVCSHPSLKNYDIQTTGYLNQRTSEDILDTAGHGTAIASLVLKDLVDVDVKVLKLFDELYTCDIDALIDALTFVEENNDYDLINMSFGLTAFESADQVMRLEYLCNQLTSQGSILVSAFDNDGAISYPAYFDTVVGVDSSRKARKRQEYEIVTHSCVNILGYGAVQKVPWSTPPYTIIDGNSFACANVSNVLIKNLSMGHPKEHLIEIMKKNALHVQTFGDYSLTKGGPEWLKGSRAILLPFSKEMHSLIAFETLLNFHIVGIYDIKYSTSVKKHTTDLIKYRQVTDRIVQNMSDIDWASNTFDTVILGHLEALSVLFKKDLLDDITRQCAKYNKKIYSFDSIVRDNVYYPHVYFEHIPKGRFGKLHQIHLPVVGVFGTSSSQGKFTLQLALREQLLAKGYDVGQIGTEPTGYCFDMDYTFPYGYNATVETTGHHNIQLLNEWLHQLDLKNKDIAIVGTQANTAFYGTNNLENYPLQQLDVLYGTMADAFVLVVNPHDEIAYIKRTIQGTEHMIESKCLAVVVYPFVKSRTLGALFKKVSLEGTDDYEAFKASLENQLNIPVIGMEQALNSFVLTDKIINFFSS